jgi:raffinose/stachyose/melibiose transport system substrate-binding protein
MKKVITLAFVLYLISGIFTGCGSSPDVSQSADSKVTGTTVAESSLGNNGTTISYMASRDWIQKAEQDLGLKFEQETGIKVDYQIIPADQYQNLLKTKLNAGECTDLFGNQSGKYDLVSLLNIDKNGVDLSNEEWAKRVDPQAAEQLTYNGKLYGMPISDVSACWAIVYNKSIFQKLGIKIPTNYAEFKDACKKISDSGITPIYESVSDGWHHVLWFPEIGPRYEEVTPDLTDKLNNNQTTFAENKTMLTALRQLQELIDLEYFGKNYMSNTYADTEKNMASGKYAMTVYNQGLPGQIEKQFPEVKANNFSYFVIPLADNQILNINPEGPSEFIYSGSKNINAAKKYLAYLAKPENLQYLVDNTDKFNTLPFSGIKDKYSDEIKTFYSKYTKQGIVYQTQIKYLNPQWMDIGEDLSAMFTGVIKPEAVLNAIDKRRGYFAKAAKDSAWTK